MYLIYCIPENDFAREFLDSKSAILLFETKQAACERAAKMYGFKTYTEAKRLKYCEVIKQHYIQLEAFNI